MLDPLLQILPCVAKTVDVVVLHVEADEVMQLTLTAGQRLGALVDDKAQVKLAVLEVVGHLIGWVEIVAVWERQPKLHIPHSGDQLKNSKRSWTCCHHQES